MVKVKSFVNLWLTLFAIWLIANASLDPQVILGGIVIAAVIALPLSAFGGAYADIRLGPKAIAYYFMYLAAFSWELLLANFNVARLVLSPKIAINPGIVEVKTRLKSRTGRMVLANSITLTPGTLVVDIDGDSLFVHWIYVSAEDPQGATRAIAEKFEKYLRVIYG